MKLFSEILSGGEFIAGGELEDFMYDIILLPQAELRGTTINDRGESLSLGGFANLKDA